MKINGSTDTRRIEQSSGPTAKPTESVGQPVAAADQVQLSDLAAHLGSLEASLKADGEFDAARVDRMREALAKGGYQVDAETVADKLIADARALLARKS